jgi:radical SAM superfamily enzyme YgiQ (UPF0313 family)
MKRRMLIVMPDACIHKLKIGPVNRSFREAPLTATSLAALVPEELEFDIKIIDESIDAIPFDEHFDLVAISCLTGTALKAYRIADIFRIQGSTVILGGVHITLMPEEAKQHADSVVKGFAERTWPQLLRDYINGNMKQEYSDPEMHFSEIPAPRRDLQNKNGYMIPNVVSATRGCKAKCDFCTVPVAGYGWHERPVGEVIAEIKNIPARRFVFNDVSMGENPEYLKELLTAMIPLNKIWGGLLSTKAFQDEEIADLLKKSGCVYILIGLESINNMSLKSIFKGFNRFEEYSYIIGLLHSINVVLMGCFIFGFDDDNQDIFKRTVEFTNDFKVDIPRYAIYTPYPGTEAFTKLTAEGRILHHYWQHYDTQHVVFQPKNMTPQQLDEGFRWAFRKTYGVYSSLKRTIHTGKNFPITFGGNLAYNIYLNRLFSEKDRIFDIKNTATGREEYYYKPD